MQNINLYSEIMALPENLQQEVSDYVDFLKHKHQISSTKSKRKFGFAKNKIVMAQDFNAPLEDFKDYM